MSRSIQLPLTFQLDMIIGINDVRDEDNPGVSSQFTQRASSISMYTKTNFDWFVLERREKYHSHLNGGEMKLIASDTTFQIEGNIQLAVKVA